MSTHIRMHIRMYAHTYVRTYVNTHTHAHIHRESTVCMCSCTNILPTYKQLPYRKFGMEFWQVSEL